MRYIVYELWDPRDDAPFYIGWSDTMSASDRVATHIKEAKGKPNSRCNRHKCRKIMKILNSCLTIKVVQHPLGSKEESIQLEIELIAKYGRSDLGNGPLTNMTDGGDGFRGWSDEQRQKHIEFNKKSWEERFGKETAERMRLEVSNRVAGKKQSPTHVANRSRAMIGKNVGNVSIGRHSRERQIGRTAEEIYGEESGRLSRIRKSEAAKGRSWYNDGTEEYLVYPKDAAKRGLCKGRIVTSKTLHTCAVMRDSRKHKMETVI